ncbi:6-phosphogluconolactonase [Serratia rubidaea]|uniref:6-phosphogluconolactonase n=3 Tax=Serratia rubidaea TaxID=61652 RepID=A0A3S4H8Q2_SERRU|nr:MULTISPECIES: 6-phosphogluconolactonase [Serratia]AGB81543.1 3-carboxymuconate cyclase [Serratia sp. FGI94]MBD8451080.1 6-phosphogluconolactonase [Serratia rubidaea]MCR0999383.1 6-phosphogluconolactonase [Serratia rubidaea]MDK1704083.1 6-phosphogluconolactonase [Serratia rubidaea]QPR61797.1 6-phosphogluconolactonase [Serratia rubidaea]
MKQIVYVASPESQQIHVWQLDDAGALALLQTVDVPGQVQPMAIHPDRTHLYVGVRPAFGVVSYRIEHDGTLQEAGMAPLPGSPTHLSTDLQGRYLFAVSYSGNNATISPIGHDGVVTAPLQQLDGLTAPHSANIDPTNQLLLVPCLKEDRVRLFDLSLEGKLTPHSQQSVATAAGAGPRHMAFHANQRYAYLVNELNSTVDVLAIEDGGKRYATVQTINAMPADFDGTCWAADIHLTPDGRFLYISDRTASILSAFAVSADGSTLSVIGHYPTEQQPRGFNIDHGGRFVLSVGQKSDHLAVHEIQADGSLKDLARYPVGKGPMWVSVLAK